MRSIFVLFSIIYLANSFSIHGRLLDEWRSFKIQYGKNYEDSEDEARLLVFIENRNRIAEHNRKYEMGLVTYSMAINQFGDLTTEEYSEMLGLSRLGRQNIKTNGSAYLEPANIKLPNELDWKTAGVVTPVKDQGRCGSCWSFSATGSLEGQLFRQHGRLVSLSEQNLMDCSVDYGNNGCQGGFMSQAFDYVKANGGLDTEASYPYEGQTGACRYNRANSAVQINGYVELPEGDEAKLLSAVASVGPISVGYEATGGFMSYESGVYYESECSDQLNHAILVVGYGTDASTGVPYWLVKNSWGTSWGENGYGKVARNKDNNCGIASLASYPLLK